MTLAEYRKSTAEQMRERDLLSHLTPGNKSVLDIGTRDGYYARKLLHFFEHVTALDLEVPQISDNRITPVKGDVCDLKFASDSFDCVFCAEVLEHVPDLKKAAAELVRVSKSQILIGVPFEQDTRVGKTTCITCGQINPPWGHINRFSENALIRLFPGCRLRRTTFIGTTLARTNSLSSLLTSLGKNPWGTYDQLEPCINCGKKLLSPTDRTLFERLCSAVGYRFDKLQQSFLTPRPMWIHVLFEKVSD